jgi:hypothetical protein
VVANAKWRDEGRRVMSGFNVNTVVSTPHTLLDRLIKKRYQKEVAFRLINFAYAVSQSANWTAFPSNLISAT